jgi:phage/plasmid-associated DNA primase
MTQPLDAMRERLAAGLQAADERTSPAWWRAQWEELDAAQLEAQWRTDVLEAQAAGADAATMDGLVVTLAARLGIGRRAVRQAIREAVADPAALEENTTHWWARQWIRRQDALGGLRCGPGCAYYTRGDDPIWLTMTLDDITVDIGAALSGPGCRNRNDYRSVARHALAILERDETRAAAGVRPDGVALGDQLLTLTGGEVVLESLTADHNCRFRINAKLQPLTAAPLYSAYLAALAPEGTESWEQIRLAFGQAAFLVLFNLGERVQQAILLSGAAGSGKSTGQAVLSALVPRELRCAVPPDKWSSEYQLAHMSRAVLNVVEDLDYRHLLGAEFKRFVGNQTVISAREPYGMAFDFEPLITHCFSANELPATRVHDEGFWRRWHLVPFFHQLPREQRVDGLAQAIVRDELGAVVQHALDSAGSMFDAAGKLGRAPPEFQTEMLRAWEVEQNVVLQFLLDDEWCKIGPEETVGRTLLYETFCSWSRAKSYAAMGHRTWFREFSRATGGLGIVLKKPHGTRVWSGVGLVAETSRPF